MNQEPIEIIQNAVQSQTISITLEDHCVNFLDLRRKIRDIDLNIKQVKENSPEWKEYDELNAKISALKTTLRNKEEVDSLTEKKKDLKSEQEATAQVICALIKEKKQTLFEMEQGDFCIVDKLAFRKKKKDE